VIVRKERDADIEAIRAVNDAAFKQPGEGMLVDALRANGGVMLSLVAQEDGPAGAIVGHILFSPVTVEAESGRFGAAGLAPLAVLPDKQSQGIGSRLVRDGLDLVRRKGVPGCVLLGSPKYYSRFGFDRASRIGLYWKTQPTETEHFLMVELTPGTPFGRGGLVSYRPEFDTV